MTLYHMPSVRNYLIAGRHRTDYRDNKHDHLSVSRVEAAFLASARHPRERHSQPVHRSTLSWAQWRRLVESVETFRHARISFAVLVPLAQAIINHIELR